MKVWQEQRDTRTYSVEGQLVWAHSDWNRLPDVSGWKALVVRCFGHKTTMFGIAGIFHNGKFYGDLAEKVG